jgi:hypothetical protein
MRRAMENPNGKTNVSGVFAWLYVHLAIDAEKYELTDPCCHTIEQKPKFQIWIVPSQLPGLLDKIVGTQILQEPPHVWIIFRSGDLQIL